MTRARGSLIGPESLAHLQPAFDEGRHIDASRLERRPPLGDAFAADGVAFGPRNLSWLIHSRLAGRAFPIGGSE